MYFFNKQVTPSDGPPLRIKAINLVQITTRRCMIGSPEKSKNWKKETEKKGNKKKNKENHKNNFQTRKL